MNLRLSHRVSALVAFAFLICSCSRVHVVPTAPDPEIEQDSLGTRVSPPNLGSWSELVWAAETNEIFYAVSGGRGVVGVHAGTGAHRIVAPSAVYRIAMSSSGRFLYYVTAYERSLARLDLATGTTSILADSADAPLAGHGDSLVAFRRTGSIWSASRLMIASSRDGLRPLPRAGFPLAFSPDDQLVASSMFPDFAPIPGGNEILVQNARTGVVSEPITIRGHGIIRPSWTARGLFVPSLVRGTDEWEVWLRGPEGERRLYAGVESVDPSSFSWSRDGARLAFTSRSLSPRGAFLTAWVVEPASGNLFRVANGLVAPAPGPPSPGVPPMPSLAPPSMTAFSPDGLRLAYSSEGKVFVADIFPIAVAGASMARTEGH